MLERPNISEVNIANYLRRDYLLRNASLIFLPLGGDVDTAVYRVESEADSPHYLKLRRGDFNKASVLVPHFLKENGIDQVIAPLPTIDGQYWAKRDMYSMALYPFVEGQNGVDAPLTAKQWIELGKAVKGLHDFILPEEIGATIPHESYPSNHRNNLRALLNLVHEREFTDPVAADLADFMKTEEAKLGRLVSRAEELGEELKEKKPESVLCHADLHGRNVLTEAKGDLYVVDWDTVMYAPKERDLMSIGAGIIGIWNKREEEELFYQGYGATDINRDALLYYRYARVVEDFSSMCQRLLLANEGGKDRAKSLEKLKRAFEPNRVIEIAIREQFFQPR